MTLNMDAISSKLCLVRRFYPTDLSLSYKAKVLPITTSIGSRIAFRLRNVERRQQISLFKYLTVLPSAKKIAGIVFEAYCQQCFSGGIQIILSPMVHERDLKLSGNVPKNKWRRQPQWHTSNTTLAPPSLEKERTAVLRKMTSLVVRPSSSFEFSPDDLVKKLKIEPDVYYTPSRVRFVHHVQWHPLSVSVHGRHEA
jgi:hypothetical protein